MFFCSFKFVVWIKVFFKKNVKIISTIKFKKYIAIHHIFSITLSIFSHLIKICLIILLKINKSSKIDCYYSILLFDLAIYLKIKKCEKFLVNAKK